MGRLLFREFGRLPSELWAQTPHQLASLMRATQPNQAAASVPMDSVPGLAKANRARAAKGLPPVTGPAFKSVLKSVPPARRR